MLPLSGAAVTAVAMSAGIFWRPLARSACSAAAFQVSIVCSLTGLGAATARGAEIAAASPQRLITTKIAGEATEATSKGAPPGPPKTAPPGAAGSPPPPPPTAAAGGQAVQAARPAGGSPDYSIVLRLAQQLASRRGDDGDAPPLHPGHAGLVSGLQDVALAPRRVLIFNNARSPEQQGRQKTSFNRSFPSWSIEYLDAVERWINPLIGWTSTADSKHQAAVNLQFYRLEEAIAFCDRQGWEYEVQPPQYAKEGRGRRWATYGDNFSVKRHGLPDLSHLPSNSAPQQPHLGGGAGAGGGGGAASAGSDARRTAEKYGSSSEGSSN